MSADNDRHGTRPGANGKRWVRSIGAHGERMRTVLILPSLVCARTHTRICVHRRYIADLRTRARIRRLERLGLREPLHARESRYLLLFLREQRVSPRIGIARGFSPRLFQAVKCCSESKLIYYPVVIRKRDLLRTMMDPFLTEISTVARYPRICSSKCIRLQ